MGVMLGEWHVVTSTEAKAEVCGAMNFPRRRVAWHWLEAIEMESSPYRTHFPFNVMRRNVLQWFDVRYNLQGRTLDC
jgi:hypothetical protein